MKRLIVAHAVGVTELPIDHVRENLCVSVRVPAKTIAALDEVIVDNAQGMKVLACACAIKSTLPLCKPSNVNRTYVPSTSLQTQSGIALSASAWACSDDECWGRFSSHLLHTSAGLLR